MKKLIPLLLLISVALTGCSSNEQSRMEYIERTYKTREIFIQGLGDNGIYIVRLSDGSVLLVERNDLTKPEKLSYRQIFSPIR
jgi:major membrane immunogen (membrane-anchored lipoprotein)